MIIRYMMMLGKKPMNFERVVGLRVVTVWIALIAVFVPGFAGAEEESATLSAPQKVIQGTSDQLQRGMQRPEIKSNFAKATALVETIIDPSIDFDRVSIMVLGKYWKTATPDQRERFKKEFRRLLVRTYTTAFTEYADWKIRYLPSQEGESSDKTLVRTEILQSGAPPVAVNYRMVNTKGAWKVYDVLIEGISLLQNYRTSFTNQIGDGGSIDKLIADIASRNDTAHKEPIPEGGVAAPGS
jgi:phospholipid transport system substrate-binding protein